MWREYLLEYFFPGITQHFTFCVSVFLAPVICILSLCSSLKLLPFYSDHTARSGWNSPQEWLGISRTFYIFGISRTFRSLEEANHFTFVAIKHTLYNPLSLSLWDIKKCLSDPSGTDLSLVFSTSSPSPSPSPSSRPVSDNYYKCLIYHIQAWGSPQPIHFLKAHDISSPNTDENTNTKTNKVTKTKTPRE